MRYNYSIIVPYRDKYDLFVKAVDSIPDRNDIQIVIVDNAIEALPKEKLPTKQQSKVVYTTSSPTKGAGCARNEGLKYVEGKFLLFLDADDYFTPEAFDSFDKYLNSDYDIVFFKPTSIRLCDGTMSDRHVKYSSYIDDYNLNNNDCRLRYWWVAPWSKLFRTEFVKQGAFQFDEIKVSNDSWFSLMTGHYAVKICADDAIVYVVTELGAGSSLTKMTSRENSFIRFDTAIRKYKFLESVGRKDQCPRLLGFVRIAMKNFGFVEALRYVKYALKNRVGIL